MQSNLLIPDLPRDSQPGEALILFLPVFLGLGTGLYFALPFEPPAPVLWGMLVASILAAVASGARRNTYMWRWLAASFICISLGFVLAQLRTQGMHTNLLTQRLWNADVRGIVQSAEHAGTGWRIIVSKAHVNNGTKKYTLRLSIRQRGFTPHLGQYIQAKATLMPASPPFVPGAFDFQRHAYFQGLSGYGYAFKVISEAKRGNEKESILENYRNWIASKVYGYLRSPEAGVVTALLTGQRAGIDKKTTQELQQSGLQHIISISGLHVSLLAGIVFYITRLLMALNMRLALTWPIKKIAALCALGAIMLYMSVVGLSPPTVRSVIMTGIVLIAILADREAINLRLVAIAAIVLLLIQPESVLDIGFQLSFAAVRGLVAFYQYTRDFWLRPFWHETLFMKALRVVLMSVITTIIATIATAPLVLLHFQQIPLLSMVSNALAGPIMAFTVMPGTFLSYLLLPFPILGKYAIKWMGLGVDWILDISSFVAHLPAAVWRAPVLPVSTVLLLLTGLFFVLALKNRIRWSGLVFCAIAITPLFFNPSPDIFLTHDRIIMMPDPASGKLYVEGRLDSFQKKMFLQLTGKKQIEHFDCKTDVCDFSVNETSIRLIRTVEALNQACRRSKDLILTRYYLDRRCKGEVVIDRHDLEDKQGALVWIGNEINIRFGRSGEMRRPWQQEGLKQRWYLSRKFVK